MAAESHPVIRTNKYAITETEKVIRGRKLYQIKALKSFGDVEEGDLGGWVEKDANLSQEGLCWVGENARVYGDAVVRDDAIVAGNAKVFGGAEVYGNAQVKGDVQVCGDAKVYGTAYLTMARRYTAGNYFDAKQNEPSYTIIAQYKESDYDASVDRKYLVASDVPEYKSLTDEILELEETIDEQAWEIEELKKRIPSA